MTSSKEKPIEMVEQLNPRWIKASMSILQASSLAAAHGCFLKASWTSQMGLRVVAVPRQ